MNILAAIRRRQKRWIPRLSALLAVVWVGMLWQPCVSAAGPAGHVGHTGQAQTALPAEHAGHVPHTSQTGDTGQAEHAGRAAHKSHTDDTGHVERGEQHCPHCPPTAHGDCATLTEECASLDRFDADRRTAKLNFGTGADDVPQVPLPHWSEVRPLPRPTVSAGPEDCGALPQGPPLNILFCVWLS